MVVELNQNSSNNKILTGYNTKNRNTKIFNIKEQFLARILQAVIELDRFKRSVCDVPGTSHILNTTVTEFIEAVIIKNYSNAHADLT